MKREASLARSRSPREVQLCLAQVWLEFEQKKQLWIVNGADRERGSGGGW